MVLVWVSGPLHYSFLSIIRRAAGMPQTSGYGDTIETAGNLMDALLERLDTKLREWKPETADQVRGRLAEIIDAADQDALDILRSRAAEQEVLNRLMSPRAGEVWLADLGLAAKTRPVVIVSRHDPEPPRALVLYVPLTTQDRQSSYEVPACCRIRKCPGSNRFWSSRSTCKFEPGCQHQRPRHGMDDEHSTHAPWAAGLSRYNATASLALRSASSSVSPGYDSREGPERTPSSRLQRPARKTPNRTRPW